MLLEQLQEFVRDEIGWIRWVTPSFSITQSTLINLGTQLFYYRLFQPVPTKVQGGKGLTTKSHLAKQIAVLFPNAEATVTYKNRFDSDLQSIKQLPGPQIAKNIAWVRVQHSVLIKSISQD